MKKTKKEETKIEQKKEYKKADKSIEVKKTKKISLKRKLKPFMDYLGILNYHVTKLDYYEGINHLYIIEADYLETFVLKIYDEISDKYAASIEKHFITNAKALSKFTPNVNVAHDKDENLTQFLFTDRRPGALKTWDSLNATNKSEVIKDIAKLMYKIHTYNSIRTLKKNVYGKVYDTHKEWNTFLQKVIDKKILDMQKNGEKKSEIIKFQLFCDSKLVSLSSHKITPHLLHGSISLNKKNQIRSLLFLGNKISSMLNFEESIYGDNIWDLAVIYHQVLSKNKIIEKDFFNVYGKLKDEEKERLEFYEKILF